MHETAAPLRNKARSIAFTDAELAALDFIKASHGPRYQSFAAVLQDYTLVDAVAFHRRALELATLATSQSGAAT